MKYQTVAVDLTTQTPVAFHSSKHDNKTEAVIECEGIVESMDHDGLPCVSFVYDTESKIVVYIESPKDVQFINYKG